jgi:hypothetical protein
VKCALHTDAEDEQEEGRKRESNEQNIYLSKIRLILVILGNGGDIVSGPVYHYQDKLTKYDLAREEKDRTHGSSNSPLEFSANRSPKN